MLNHGLFSYNPKFFWMLARSNGYAIELMSVRPVPSDAPVPANIVFVPVDADGQPATPGEAGVRMEVFVAGTEPKARSAAAVGGP